nr:MAG TPA: hypothetical protein [Caudoviricetes sp.]
MCTLQPSTVNGIFSLMAANRFDFSRRVQQA